MSKIHFIISVTLSGLCLAVAIALIIIGQINQSVQLDMQRQQEEINRGSLSQQVGTALLRDMAVVAVKDSKMKDILAKNGYTVNVNNNSQPSSNP